MSTMPTEVMIEVTADENGARRLIPAERLVGVAEIAERFTADGRFADQYPDGIERQRVSSWGSPERRATNGFPAPVVDHLSRGLLWDWEEVKRWQGPPGRWASREG